MTIPPLPCQGGAKRFGDVLTKLLKAKRFYQKSRYGPLVAAWQDAVGEEIGSRTKISAYEHGRLTVEVDSSVLLHELSSFMRSALLNQLKRTRGSEDIVELTFRLGSSTRGSGDCR